MAASVMFSVIGCTELSQPSQPKYENEYNKFTEISKSAVSITNKSAQGKHVTFKLVKAVNKNKNTDSFLGISIPLGSDFLIGEHVIFYLDGKPLRLTLGYMAFGNNISISNSTIANAQYVSLNKETFSRILAANTIRYEISGAGSSAGEEVSGTLTPEQMNALKQFNAKFS
jgi:hypothetical protein